MSVAPAGALDLKDLITFGLALLGAVLGVMNTWRAISRDQPKVKVIPKHAIPVGAANSQINFSIEAVNLSTFAITITEMGLLHRGTQTRSALLPPVLIDGGPWPRRLEPRTTVTVFGHLDLVSSKHPIRCAYAKTDCGLTFRGTSRALAQLADQ